MNEPIEYLPSLDPAVQRLLPIFLSNRRRELVTLGEALARGDSESLRRAGHNLHGAGGAYGVPGIMLLGERLENAAGAGDLAAAAEVVDELQRLLARLAMPAREK